MDQHHSNCVEEKVRQSSNLAVLFGRVKGFCVSNIRVISRFSMGIIVMLIVIHKVYPPILEAVGEWLHFYPPSFASILTLVLSVWIFERLIVLQEDIKRPSVSVYQRSMENAHLQELMIRRRPKQVDLLQVSGQTVLPLLIHLAEVRSRAKVRLLLLDDTIAKMIDTDGAVDHVARIKTTIDHLHLLEAENPGFKVEIRRYDTWPALCAIIVDEDLVSMSWSPTFRDPQARTVVRVRGHLATTVTAVGQWAEPLIGYARGHFGILWNCNPPPHKQ